MPIAGRTPGDAARQFCDYLNSVLAQTITEYPLTLIKIRGQAFELAFRERGRASDVPLQSTYGPLYLFLGQTCDATLESGKHRLRTIAYRYHLRREGDDEALLRWEYKRERGASETPWCRHHLQGPIALGIGTLSLNDVHLPTGWVTIEEVIRFCIVDLGVRPTHPEAWDRILEESYQRFKSEFAPLGEV